MRNSFALLALAAAVQAVPQGVPGTLLPSSPDPAGCSPDFSGTFNIANINITSTLKKRTAAEKRQAITLTLSLSGGVLKDSKGRTGYIAGDNRQFQFDAPPQAGAVITAGFSACSNSTLALGGSTVWYQCNSGSGYNNLYDQPYYGKDKCEPIYLEIVSTGGAAQTSDGQPVASSAGVTQLTDGQPRASSAVTQITDGQPQVSSAPGVSQITDGQPQVSSAAGVSQITDGQPQVSKAPVVSQITDGQPQVTTAAMVSQITDGQPQVSAPMVVSQISDGQPQVSSAASAVASQITDGQPQVSSAAPAVASQITDGQPQVSSVASAVASQITDGQPQVSTAPVVSQISDGQPQVSTAAAAVNGTVTTGAPAQFTGAAAPMGVRSEHFALAAGMAALAFL